MSLLLKHSGWQNGGYPFKDPRTGRHFEGMTVNLFNQAQRVALHRRGNPKLYPPQDPQFLNPQMIEIEIQEQICVKRPDLCNEAVSRRPVNSAPWAPPTICPKCNGPITERLCPTCSGRRVTGWECKPCKTIYRRR